MARIYECDIGDYELLKLHEYLEDILDHFADLCDRHGLKYYLAAGTLLGAIRHKGFIPWDDDIDVIMPRDDYEKLQKIASSLPQPGFYLQCCENDPKYWALFGKYKKAGTEVNENSIKHLNVDKAMFIDIFPLDDSDIQSKKMVYRNGKKVKFLNKCIETKVGIGCTYNRFDKRIIRMLLKPFTINVLTKIRHKLMVKENNQGKSFYVSYGSDNSTEKTIFPKEYYGEGVMVPFGKREYRIPVEWNLLLTASYGDYMTLPPIEKRKMTHKPVYIDFGDE